MKKIKTLLLISLVVFLVISCGNKNSDGDKSSTNPPIEASTESVQPFNWNGSYQAILRPLNNHLSGHLPSGMAMIEVQDNQLKVETFLDDDAKVIHIQSVHMGSRCPSSSDDKNNDGIIDVKEAYLASGPVFFPLDDDLSSIDEGLNIYPKGPSYTYRQKVLLNNLTKNLINHHQKLVSLTNRVILIHGVAIGTSLPGTTATLRDFSKELSAPVACGVVRKKPEVI